MVSSWWPLLPPRPGTSAAHFFVFVCFHPSSRPVFHPKKSAVNFTSQDIYLAMQEGQRAVWAKLPAIQARWGAALAAAGSRVAVGFIMHGCTQPSITRCCAPLLSLLCRQAACAIEVCIDEQLRRVTHQVRQRRALEKAAAQVRSCPALLDRLACRSLVLETRGPVTPSRLASPQHALLPANPSHPVCCPIQRHRRALAGGSSRMRAALPSWLHIPSLGKPLPYFWCLVVEIDSRPVRQAVRSQSQAGSKGGKYAMIIATTIATKVCGPHASTAASQCLRPAGLPPSDSLLSMPSAPSLGAADVSTVAAAAEGTTASAGWANEEPASTAPSSPPLSPRRPLSRLRHAAGGSRSSGGSVEGSRHSSSREGSRHGGGMAALALGVPLATPEQVAAEEGVQATAGAIAVAGIEVAAEALEELEEGAAASNGTGEAAAAAGVEVVPHPPAPFESPRWVAAGMWLCILCT